MASEWEKNLNDKLVDLQAIKKALRCEAKMIQLKAMSILVEKQLYDEEIIEVLHRLCNSLSSAEDRIAGMYMLGHFSITALYEIQSDLAKQYYSIEYGRLDESEKNMVDILIKSRALHSKDSCLK
ncbi:hypothetical protein [Paenibacillus macerans]|uniref:hypothetical protein n=1 Tax=Paenibacillus macerans TaxID=44252 RepID=UPI0020413FA6|nr:hypothetical protein [Paenibacillus macerans]MCM3703203.1 hypothetical protein [Paenibacillus macerans]